MPKLRIYGISICNRNNKETERAPKSADVLKAGKMKESIPHQLITDYQGVVIIPNLINAGFAV